MALTDAALRALKPKDKTYTVADGRGLYVEVFPTGGVIWRFRYRLNGRREKLTLGRYPDLTLKHARLKRDGAALLVATDHSPVKQKQQARVEAAEATTVATFGERYFREVVSKDRKDITMPRRYFDKIIVPMIGNQAMRDVSVDDVRSVIWCAFQRSWTPVSG